MEDQLLFRFLNGQSTSKELEEIELWMSMNKANAEWLFELERMWALKKEFQFAEPQALSEAFALLKMELEKKNNTTSQTHSFDSSHNKATKRVLFSRTKFISWSKNVAAAIIVILLTANIWQMVFPASGELNVIEVQRGNRASVTLSDGTKVWLNSESKLSYPQNFAKDTRLVLLEGEGFFDVTKNTNHPFVVHSDELEVKVLGTKFNFKAYPKEASRVFLKEGKVEVASRNGGDGQNERMILYPNDIISYSNVNGFATIQATNAVATENWISGELVFIDETLEEIVKNLERQYDVQIVIRDAALKTERYNSRAQAGVTLNQMLDLLKRTGEFDYEIQNNQVILFREK
ncbi:FecR family protein [Saccharicrinis carchari]|uniref:FecR family protein n=1 Tax=Saccharicrinis carchari TaxID=1168039 RepID=A0A521CDY2_SACCC|nr:FecR family protein [Saccharicrinis carchari]SMO57623.1 FecR family protein [Saccharicrinis carchari]